MTERTTQPVKETTPANNHRSNNYPRNNLQDISVWDGVVRLCHWGLVICFITNYFIVEPGRLYHEIAGYSAVFFVVVRIVWGFTRPPAESTYQDRHASHDISHACHNTFYDRHSNEATSYDCHNKSDNKDQSVYQDSTFCDSHNSNNIGTSHDSFYACLNKEAPSESNYASFRTIDLSSQAFKEHLQHLKLRNVPVQTGHNPFGWLMIFAVIGLFFGLGISGFLMEEIDALFGNSTLEWIHSIFADVLYACVLVHIAAVFFVQYRGRVQLLRPMITGLRRNLSRDDKP
ncbi:MULTISPECIES: cytochrome b/b6 domain-containing protein [unclassified Alteromonas]|uniref:cytochrome b/b6 domain-containing protein n=1 Tax=unclassified Alteromonas TaxID=2614992 RepID=UPI0009E00CDA|nr:MULTISPECIES: cytochrome b/b6 domain-containing protein [unclassified Alteromonas]